MDKPINGTIGGVFYPNSVAAQMMLREFGVMPKIADRETAVEQLRHMREAAQAKDGAGI